MATFDIQNRALLTGKARSLLKMVSYLHPDYQEQGVILQGRVLCLYSLVEDPKQQTEFNSFALIYQSESGHLPLWRDRLGKDALPKIGYVREFVETDEHLDVPLALVTTIHPSENVTHPADHTLTFLRDEHARVIYTHKFILHRFFSLPPWLSDLLKEEERVQSLTAAPPPDGKKQPPFIRVLREIILGTGNLLTYHKEKRGVPKLAREETDAWKHGLITTCPPGFIFSWDQFDASDPGSDLYAEIKPWIFDPLISSYNRYRDPGLSRGEGVPDTTDLGKRKHRAASVAASSKEKNAVTWKYFCENPAKGIKVEALCAAFNKDNPRLAEHLLDPACYRFVASILHDLKYMQEHGDPEVPGTKYPAQVVYKYLYYMKEFQVAAFIDRIAPPDEDLEDDLAPSKKRRGGDEEEEEDDGEDVSGVLIAGEDEVEREEKRAAAILAKEAKEEKALLANDEVDTDDTESGGGTDLCETDAEEEEEGEEGEEDDP